MWDRLFPAPKPEVIAAKMREDAEREALLHAALAEHHEALYKMYRARVERLTRELQDD